ncbi:BA75_00440T0 [Komagataella pastoris]|uniref:BA75_00440T0 n=1 Tax=Komagataella pastoris TaxID=4922 RepID=A0A1B2J851_PICPA|nr:BA75_00440T0 [Komagataella pastoris]
MSLQIDETDFVEASEGADSLKFLNEKAHALFELGVSMLVHKWDALSVAVANQWGGPNSKDKRDWISAVVVDLFLQNSVVDVALIEETLLYAMQDEFDVMVEDDSALPLAAQVLDCYRKVAIGEVDKIKESYAKWQAKQSSNGDAKYQVTVGEDPSNPDVSENEEDDYRSAHAPGTQQDEDSEMTEATESAPQPTVDDDGFTIVQRKR